MFAQPGRAVDWYFNGLLGLNSASAAKGNFDEAARRTCGQTRRPLECVDIVRSLYSAQGLQAHCLGGQVQVPEALLSGSTHAPPQYMIAWPVDPL